MSGLTVCFSRVIHSFINFEWDLSVTCSALECDLVNLGKSYDSDEVICHVNTKAQVIWFNFPLWNFCIDIFVRHACGAPKQPKKEVKIH